MGTVTLSFWLLITIIFTTHAVTWFFMSGRARKRYNELTKDTGLLLHKVYGQLERELESNRKLGWEVRDREKKLRELGTESTKVIKSYGEALVFMTIAKYAPGIIDDVRRGIDEMHKEAYTQQLRALHTKYFENNEMDQSNREPIPSKPQEV
jgi:hypothetical protein